jgi:branched-chain amino acid transport system substrate-binding protein
MRKLAGFILWCLVIAFLSFGSAPGGHAEEKVLRVGIIVSQTGPEARIGQDLRDGALLAIQEINDKWKDRGVEIKPVVEDDGGVPDQAVRAARKMIDQEVDVIFGLADNDCALAVMPLVSQAPVLMFTLATYAGLTRPMQKWIFRGNISDDDQAKILVDYLWDRLAEKKIALLHEETAYGRAGAQAQLKRIRQYQVEPAAEVSYQRGEQDFSPALEKIEASGATGILIYGMAPDAQAILRAVRERGMNVNIMASSGWDSRSLSDLPPELTQGVIVGGYLALAMKGREEVFGPSWEAFERPFTERFQREPDVMAALSYSGMICVGDALEKVDFQTRRLPEGLEKTKAFKTVLESLINFNDEDHDGVTFIHLTEFHDGQPRVWRRNRTVREQRFQAEGTHLRIGEYAGTVYETPAGTTMWMVLHFALGRPPFVKDLQLVDEYGLKRCFVGALFKEKTRVPVYRLIFGSEEDAVNALNLAPSEAEGMGTQKDRPQGATNFRNAHEGMYSDGSYWAGFKRVGNKLVMAAGGVPREDLLGILDALLKDESRKEAFSREIGPKIEKIS